MKIALISLKLFLAMLILVGFLYPLSVSIIASVFTPVKSEGSLIVINGKKIGSKLIAQKFESDTYFWPRPSALNYSTLPSTASNLGPTSKKLAEEVKKRSERYHTESDIPSDLLYASGSGLDPHITTKSAYFQAERVAAARGIDLNTIQGLITKTQESCFFQYPYACYVNVLLLNVALDGLQKDESK